MLVWGRVTPCPGFGARTYLTKGLQRAQHGGPHGRGRHGQLGALQVGLRIRKLSNSVAFLVDLGTILPHGTFAGVPPPLWPIGRISEFLFEGTVFSVVPKGKSKESNNF